MGDFKRYLGRGKINGFSDRLDVEVKVMKGLKLTPSFWLMQLHT